MNIAIPRDDAIAVFQGVVIRLPVELIEFPPIATYVANEGYEHFFPRYLGGCSQRLNNGPGPEHTSVKMQ